MNSIRILERLVGFPTVSKDSNLELIRFVRGFLEECGVRCRLVHNEECTKANLLAVVGPDDIPGVLLSGHTDVVPVEGQSWSSDPFSLTVRRSRLYGRGTADMKGFIACALRAAKLASGRDLKTPLWLSLSYDEEIGCVGVRRLIDLMIEENLRPLFCIVGEPTTMKVAAGHKGKTALVARCRGRAAHTAFAPKAVNALHLACDFVSCIRKTQDKVASSATRDNDYEIPYTTLHAARISGGIAANIVPAECSVDFEIRNVASDDPAALVSRLRECAASIVEDARGLAPETAIEIVERNAYPGLETRPDSRIVEFVKSLARQNGTIKVAFGTEAGLFATGLRTPSVICGPGSMEQGHKADEFIESEQISKCDAMLEALVERLASGIS